jgi:hypothetical protein
MHESLRRSARCVGVPTYVRVLDLPVGSAQDVEGPVPVSRVDVEGPAVRRRCRLNSSARGDGAKPRRRMH